LPVPAQHYLKDKSSKLKPRVSAKDNTKINGIIFVACYHSNSQVKRLKQFSDENIYRFNKANTKTCHWVGNPEPIPFIFHYCNYFFKIWSNLSHSLS
jgi:hypothetical protein